MQAHFFREQVGDELVLRAYQPVRAIERQQTVKRVISVGSSSLLPLQARIARRQSTSSVDRRAGEDTPYRRLAGRSEPEERPSSLPEQGPSLNWAVWARARAKKAEDAGREQVARAQTLTPREVASNVSSINFEPATAQYAGRPLVRMSHSSLYVVRGKVRRSCFFRSSRLRRKRHTRCTLSLGLEIVFWGLSVFGPLFLRCLLAVLHTYETPLLFDG